MRTIVILFLLFFSFCNAADFNDIRIYDSDGKKFSMDEFVLKLTQNDVVFFGEQHDDVYTHVLEMEVLKRLYTIDSSWNVSMEMFERDVQDTLEKYLSGVITESDFLSSSRPWGNYNTDYRPIVEFAREKNLSVLAANIPRRYASLLVKLGYEAVKGLPASEEVFTPAELVVIKDRYYDNFKKTMENSMGAQGHMGGMLERLYQAQCIKDDTMAESISGFLKKYPDRRLIHYNGAFHSDFHLGTVQKLKMLDASLEIAVISVIPVNDTLPEIPDTQELSCADFVIYCPKIVREVPLEKALMTPKINSVSIAEHNLDVRLDPYMHTITATDRVVLETGTKDRFVFYLGKDLMIDTVEANGYSLQWTSEISEQMMKFTVNPGDRILQNFFVSYHGTINEPLQGRSHDQTHDFTRGMISELPGEGIFLPPQAGWYPIADDSLISFSLMISVPVPLKIVSQGKLAKREINDSIEVSYWNSELPAEGLTAAGGNFQIDSIEWNGITISTYLFPQDASISSELLKISKDYLEFYSQLLGPYPFSRFDIVENFFASGFGLPGYTLISSQLLNSAMLPVLKDPGTIGHEIVHSWWGNSVFLTPGLGNWCEAFTTYCANFYYTEKNGKPGEALSMRKKAMLQLSFLSDAEDYPLISFKSQNRNSDSSVGYQKGAMMLHYLRMRMGDEKFFSVLKKLVEKFKGKQLSWTSIRRAFIDSAPEGEDFSDIISRFLLQKGAADLRFANIRKSEKLVEFDILQTGEIWNLQLPLRFVSEKKPSVRTVPLDSSVRHLSFSTASTIETVEADPDFHILRRIHPEEYPLSFELVLKKSPLIVVPAGEEEQLPLKGIIDLLRTKCPESAVVSGDELKKENFSSDIILLGNLQNNPAMETIGKELTGHFQFNRFGFSADNEFYGREAFSALSTVKNPYSGQSYIGIYYYNSESGIREARKLMHHISVTNSVFDAESKNPFPVHSSSISCGKSPLKIGFD